MTRTPHFICGPALAWPDGHVEYFEGRCDGELVWPPRGDKGFGYDPVFVAAGHDITFGEMEPEKNMTSASRPRLPPARRCLLRLKKFRRLTTRAPGCGIYVHWPFCQSKCPYCDFNSHVVAAVDQARWAAALTRELEHMRGLAGPRRVRSIFSAAARPR